MAKGLPGYPSNKNLQKQAANLASGAVPTRGSIRRQYALPLQSNRGFTEALIHLLQQGGGGVSSGFDSAIASQQGIDQAAAQRLAALGGPYGAGSAAAVGGMGGSALSSLVAQGAAAKNYASQIPAVAASRGQQMNAQLLQQRNQAITQRNEDYRSALQQALQTVQQNALAMSSLRSSNKNANLDRALQAQSMAQSQSQFEAQQAEQMREFNIDHSPAFLKFQAGLQQQVSAAANGSGGSGNPLSQYTPGQIAGFQKDAQASITAGIHQGVPIQSAIRSLITAGTPKQIAVWEASRIYQDAATSKPDKANFSSPKTYQRVFSAWSQANRSYRAWVAKKYWRRYKGAPSSNQPVSFGGGPH